MTLTQFLGDSITHLIPLRWQGAAFEPGSDWLLIFTVKVDTADADDGAVIQKASGLGISVAGALASVAMVPQDTVNVTAKTLLWDIQAQHATTGEVRTVASGNLRLVRDITRLTETSIPIHTTEPPYPGGGNLAADTHAAASKETPADADEIPLVDSAAAWGLKKLTWAALKAALKTHFDTLYQAAGLTWATLSGKPTTFDPSAHKASHATGGADALTPADIGAQPAGSYAPATGISPAAITGTAVITTDFRLSNARTPTAHAHVSADISDAATAATPGTLVLRNGSGGAAFAGLTLSGTGGSPFTSTLTGGVSFENRTLVLPDVSGTLVADSQLANSATIAASVSSVGDTIVLRDNLGAVYVSGLEVTGASTYGSSASWTYTTPSAAAHRTALGSGAGVGDTIFTATTAKGANEALLKTTKIKTTQTDRSLSTTYTTDSDFTHPVTAGKTYRVEFAIYTTATVNSGFKGQFTLPSVPAMISATANGIGMTTQPGGTVVGMAETTAGVIGVAALTRNGSATNGTYHGFFEVTVGVTGGNLLFQWAQVTSHADLTSVLANSAVTVIERTP